ncbi:nucleotide-binding universal stress UspA family protein [Actinocorallia herbida]|uniref:Nucleotide-binding universal stress UspA family protein n=1 Tax=Actinocorallia herbida TaxID=58109 RepID=A0A3N1D5X5_9ACTN|nr:universal stress protein [Actinocorallia herbida]ROO88488.1 nucleotide-binding universal stress UspA family protein [Actinocorallia herbida]
MSERKPVVAGVDGSEPAYAAVEWAAAEAARRHLPLRLVYAVPSRLLEHSSAPGAEAVRQDLRDGCLQALRRGADRATATDRTVRVESELIPGGAAAALVGEGERAALLVVGGRGHGELTGLLLGSVTGQVAAHAPCPVAVVRHVEPPTHNEVVVGVDTAESAQPALEFAFAEAAARGARLRAVHAWTHPAGTGHGEMQPVVFDPELVAEEEGLVLAEALAGWRARHPDVEVIPEVVRGRAVRALAGASASADVLVVGSRGRGGFPGLVLGSVGRAMLHHAHCPVIVAHSPHGAPWTPG